MRKMHDPVPDGKSGPWLREPHKRSAHGVPVYDARCERCREVYSPAKATAISRKTGHPVIMLGRLPEVDYPENWRALDDGNDDVALDSSNVLDPGFVGWWDKVCPECGRSFALYNEADAEEWYYGHDCVDGYSEGAGE